MGKRKFGKYAAYFILVAGAVIFLMPFIWMLLSAFKNNAEIRSSVPTFWPKDFTVQNFVKVWGDSQFYRFFLNSFYLATVKTAIILYTSAITGYVFSKMEFRHKEKIFLAVLCTMMIPWPVTIVPMYREMAAFGWIDSYNSLILTGLFSSFGIFMMRQNISAIPGDLIDAARIDGARELGIFHRIVVPNSLPAFSALGIFTFLGEWDNFTWPMLMINSQSKMTLPLGLALFTGRFSQDYGAIMAGTAIAVVPVVIIYLIFQKQFIEGITMTGIK